ncbi:MAG: metallophosphoesterase [Myxococcales bacterium]
MQKRTKIVLSDLHIGTGHAKGRPNAFEDFVEDDRLAQLLARLSQQLQDEDVELVLNGDVFDLLKVSVNGLFPEAITESIGALKLELCLRGHPKVVEALRAFLKGGRSRRITYLVGNHDMELVFPAVRRLFSKTVSGAESDERVHFVVDKPFYRLEGGVEIHHGHQFEALNAFDFKQLTLEKGQAEPILNLPWGSLFVLQVLNKYKEARPYLDRVKPFWPVVAAGLVLDTRFTLQMVLNSGYYFTRARVSPLWRRRRPFTKLSKFLLDDMSFFAKHEDTAQRLFKNDPSLRALIMGHTHTEMVRTYGRGERIYVNTGTWMPMVNLSLENLGQSASSHYALVRYTDKGDVRVSLMRWLGRRALREEVTF